MHRVRVLSFAAALIAAAPASASVQALPPVERAVAVPHAGTSCAAANSVDVRWVAPAAARVGMLARLEGARGDWDLVLLDAKGNRQVDASHGFASREVVQTVAPGGRGLIVRACRLRGASRTATVRIESVALPAAVPVKESLLRVKLVDAGDGNRLQKLGLDLGEDGGSGWLSVVTHGAADVKLVRSTGLPFKVAVPDLAVQDRKDRAAEKRAAAAGLAAGVPSGRTSYRDFPIIQQELKDLAAKYPAQTKLFELPQPTSQGRPIPGIEIADDPARAATDGRPTFAIVALHHAREWPAAEAAMEFVNDLLKTQDDPTTQNLLAKVRFVIVPVQNPDGYASSRAGLEPGDPDSTDDELVFAQAGGGSQAYRRKTCSGPFPAAAPCDLQPGADSNRNYGANWGGKGSSTIPYEQDYRGAGPESEPETADIHALLRKLNATIVLSIHNVAAGVQRPPGVSDAPELPASDLALINPISTKVAALTGYTAGTFYSVLGYDGSAITEDYAYEQLGAFTWTIELGPANGQFHMSYPTGVIAQWNGPGGAKTGMRGGMRELAARAIDPKYHSVLSGAAPAGTTIHVNRTSQVSTGLPCTAAPGILVRNSVTPLACVMPGQPMVFNDAVDFKMTVPDGGQYVFHVPPSTRPVVARPPAPKTEAYTVTCERGGAVKETQQVTVARGAKATLDFSGC